MLGAGTVAERRPTGAVPLRNARGDDAAVAFAVTTGIRETASDIDFTVFDCDTVNRA
ncbi:MAG: hypothetical protein NVS4B8_16160 [Herpetosiphon sp.]